MADNSISGKMIPDNSSVVSKHRLNRKHTTEKTHIKHLTPLTLNSEAGIHLLGNYDHILSPDIKLSCDPLPLTEQVC